MAQVGKARRSESGLGGLLRKFCGASRSNGLSRAPSRAPGRVLSRLPLLVLGMLAAVALVVGAIASRGCTRPGGVVLVRAATTEAASSLSPEASDEPEASTGEASGGGSGDQRVEATASRIVVHVDGAIMDPGVYELDVSEPRVNDAVLAAGGLAADADTSSVNLAGSVADGDKVHIPRAGEAVAQDPAALANGSGGEGSGLSPEGGASLTTRLVNINTATAEELDCLPGVGPSTAQAILEDRKSNGPFTSVEDLMRVSGIGEKKFAKLRGSICV